MDSTEQINDQFGKGSKRPDSMPVAEAESRLSRRLQKEFGEREGTFIAKALLEDLFGIRHAALSEVSLDAYQIDRLSKAVLQLLDGIPLQYVTSKAHFFDLELEVNPSVLIPRPETEEVVHTAKENLVGWEPLRILDVGTGSGCIAIALAKEMPGAEVMACDISGAALEVARRNAEKHQVSVDFLELDFLDSRNWSRFGQVDAVVSNPPYIDPTEQLEARVEDYEPHTALFSPPGKALAFYEALAEFGKHAMSSRLQGIFSMFMETSSVTGQDAKWHFRNRGFRCSLRRDLSDRDRILLAGR